MALKIKTFGWRNKTLDQISRIDEGLIASGHELVNEGPEVVYSNNDMYDDILEFANKQNKRPFVILNVLDLQIGNTNMEFFGAVHLGLRNTTGKSITIPDKDKIYAI